MATMRRIYLPLSTQELRQLHSAQSFGAESVAAFAVTAAQAERGGSDDDELDEYAAGQAAARAAVAGDRSVIAAVDAPAGSVEEVGDESAVIARGPLPLKRFASFHLIDVDAYEGDTDADLELSWFDATELPLLIQTLDAL